MEAQQLTANLDTGGATSAGSTEAYTGDEPPRYLNYFGFDNCGATAHVYVDRTTKARVGDTSGAVPYTVVDKADYKSNPTEIAPDLQFAPGCLRYAGRSASTCDGAHPAARQGDVHQDHARQDQQSTGEASTHGEPYSWINEQLRHVSRSGQRSTTLKLTQNQGASIHSGKIHRRGAGDAHLEIRGREVAFLSGSRPLRPRQPSPHRSCDSGDARPSAW